MARLGCNDCEGCSACCQGMGNSVVLDPYDVWHLTKGLGITFTEMIGKQVMLSVVDGLILPSLNMENQTGTCPFLNEEGRCSIHAFRPGICRLFPLGRYYHDGGFSYVLMTGECKKENRSKVKIDKWLGEPNLKAYEQFVMQWKGILEQAREKMQILLQKIEMEENGNKRMENSMVLQTIRNTKDSSEERERVLALQKKLSMELLQTYYFTPYGEDFFAEFRVRT